MPPRPPRITQWRCQGATLISCTSTTPGVLVTESAKWESCAVSITADVCTPAEDRTRGLPDRTVRDGDRRGERLRGEDFSRAVRRGGDDGDVADASTRLGAAAVFVGVSGSMWCPVTGSAGGGAAITTVIRSGLATIGTTGRLRARGDLWSGAPDSSRGGYKTGPDTFINASSSNGVVSLS
mmetsp:Transcript_49639/g.116663  ORF Transcript_49639/g.116663 Transcript_49639/m.116663 type:complete len:181 (-) Transcript_49639:293-835(-)